MFDTVGFVRGLINPLSRWGHILFDDADSYQLVVSEALILEVLDVIRRPDVVKLFRTLPTRDPAAIIAILQSAATVELREIPSVSRDPKDDVIVATAVAAGAEYLVSEDRDLLGLGEHEGVRIINAVRFLDILMGEGQ
ncbi:MAG: putative toxin-antitoxin system toxin component, PIN family [Thermomicrobiales bacterium]